MGPVQVYFRFFFISSSKFAVTNFLKKTGYITQNIFRHSLSPENSSVILQQSLIRICSHLFNLYQVPISSMKYYEEFYRG